MSNNSIIQAGSNFVEVTVDPLFANVVFLMAMETNTLVDTKGHPLTATGPAAMAAVPSPFSQFSLATNNTGYVTAPDSEDWFLSNQDFTYEAYVMPSSSATTHYFLSQAAWADSDGSVDFLLYGATPGANSHTAAGNMGTISSSVSIPLDQWSHIAYEREGSKFTIFVNGNNRASVNDGGTTALMNSTKRLAIGASSNGGNIFQGRVGPARITKGVARYKGNFIPNRFATQGP